MKGASQWKGVKEGNYVQTGGHVTLTTTIKVRRRREKRAKTHA
jgi:hypothetical protein